jgi:hypothetical protein
MNQTSALPTVSQAQCDMISGAMDKREGSVCANEVLTERGIGGNIEGNGTKNGTLYGAPKGQGSGRDGSGGEETCFTSSMRTCF